LVLAISLVVIATCAGPASAAGRVEARGVRGANGSQGWTAPSPENIQAFRSDFSLALDSYAVVMQRLGNSRGQRLAGEAKVRMDAVTDEQLAALFGRVGVPDLSEMLRATDTLVSRTPNRDRGPLTAGLPGAPPILSDCNNISHSSGFTLGALIAFEVARTVLAAAEFACNEVVVVLGEGGNGSAVCIPFAIAQDVAAIPFELASFCAGEEDSAVLQGTFDRLEHVHTDLESARSAIITEINANTAQIIDNVNSNTALIVNNDNSNRTQIINNDNSNRTQIINNDNANRDILIGQLHALGCEIVRLLNTPDGQRASAIAACQGQPGFPYSWNKK
jgi:hypothetical protein